MNGLLLAIDVGNSRIKAGLFASQPVDLPQLVKTGAPAAVAFPADALDPVALLAQWLTDRKACLSAVVAGGVQPAVLEALRSEWNRAGIPSPLTILDRPSAALLANQTRLPERVGADRLFDAMAANVLRPAGQGVVIVDAGTATTVDLLNEQGAFLGGAILPGLETLAAALHDRTALLPRVIVSESDPLPDPLGDDTLSAIRAGLHWGHVGAVKELVARLSARSIKPPMVLLTGGAAPRLRPHLPTARHEPHLTLQGIILSFRGRT